MKYFYNFVYFVHKYLEDHKKDEKTHESKQDQDKHDLFNKDITSFLNAKKLSSEGNKEEEKKSEEQKSRNKDGELSQNKWKSWKAAINGFKWDKNTDHQTWSAWNEVFPISNKAGVNVQCIKWWKYFCHQQWKWKNFMKNKLGALNMWPFVGINQNSLNKNSFEQKILKDYIAKKKFSQMQFRDDILNKLETETWKIRDTSNKEQALKKTSTIWMSCAPEIWDHIIYKYRETIKNELPPNITNRSDCWFGSKWRTQVHNQSHASKLNHIWDCKK